jgi:hypothetical protein
METFFFDSIFYPYELKHQNYFWFFISFRLNHANDIFDHRPICLDLIKNGFYWSLNWNDAQFWSFLEWHSNVMIKKSTYMLR